MKKIFIGFFGLVLTLLVALILAPIIFKQDIQDAIDKQLEANLNADAFYDTNGFDLALISTFPDLTVSIQNFGIRGIGNFEGDTLISVKEFSLSIDLLSVLGDEVSINSVGLDEPVINILVLEDGSANYDIAVSAGEEPDSTDPAESSAPLSIAIKEWNIVEGDIIYLDETLPFYATLFGFNHNGSGDFSLDVFEMATSTRITSFSMGYDGDEYISDKIFSADVNMQMDLENMKFVFMENRLGLNDFNFGLDGYVSMPGDDIDMDIDFKGKEIDMRSIISLIPGLYTDYLTGVDASGNVGFEGYVKGTLNETDMPKVNTRFSVSDGQIGFADYPIPMEEIEISAVFDYPSADLRDASFNVDNFSMLIDGEATTASLMFKDFEDYFWDLSVEGNVDLEKLTKIIPIEDTEFQGRINAGLKSIGRYSDVENEDYQKLTTSGFMNVSGFYYTGSDLPQGFGIERSALIFNPETISLTEFEGNAGKTDLSLKGSISNYIAFALSEEEPLKGNLDFASTMVDVDEWMVTSDTSIVEEEDTAALEMVRIPTNIVFELNSSIEKLLYDGLAIESFKGGLLVENGAIFMNDVSFDLLDGAFEMNGSIETIPEEALYSYDMEIENMNIPKAFQAFNTIQKMAPFAEKMTGDFSAKFDIRGSLAQDMMPIYETMFGSGDLNIKNGTIQEVKLLTAASAVTNLDNGDGTVKMKDVNMAVEIIEGNVFVEPFDVNMGGYTTTISGSNNVSGELDYSMVVREVPTGAAGQALNAALSSFTGGGNAVASKVDVNLGVKGTFDDPSVKFLGVSNSGSQDQRSSVAAKAKDELEAKKEEAKAKIEETKKEVVQQVTEAKDEAKEKVSAIADETKETAKEEVKEVAEEAKDKLKGLLKKKKKGGGL